MTPLRSRLTAQERCPRLEISQTQRRFDLALRHKRHEPLLVHSPRSLVLLVVVEESLGRGEEGLVFVPSPDKLAQEEWEILRLCESGELRRVIQAYVEQPIDLGVS